jgi:uncharacterized protein YjbI with pentapeptide repeats
LTRANLYKADLMYSYLIWANLDDANLEGANLKGANLEGANLKGAKLTGAHLTDANLAGTDLTGARLLGAKNFNTADTRGAVFCETIMPDGSTNNSGCGPLKSNLAKLLKTKKCQKCDLSGANLTDLNLDEADLTEAHLNGATLSLANLKGANLTKANLEKAELWGAGLTKANLKEANLKFAILVRADLTGANLTKANLTEANLKDAKGFNTSDTSGAVFCKTIMPDGSENNSACHATLATENPSSADFQKGLAAAKSGDFATALREWEPLAEQGYADAQSNLGVMYYKGRGVPQDDLTAVKWYTLAAEQGYADAQFNLGVMYADIQDYKTAVKWYTLAADQGEEVSQYNLGVMYASGMGVPQDNVYAHMWMQIAEASGYKGLDLTGTVNKTALFKWSLAKDMTPTQIKKAQELAREWLLRNTKGVE